MTIGATPDVVSERVTVSGVSGRYAVALFDLAKDGNALDAIAGDLDALEALLRASDDLRRLIKSPLFGRDQQSKALDSILGEVSKLSGGREITDLTRRFIGVVAQNGRLGAIDDIIGDFHRLLAAHKGEITAEVAAAYELNDSQLGTLEQKLKAIIGRDVNLETRVDEALIGGLVVKLGSRMINSSLKTKLNNLQVAMKEVG